MPMKKIIVRVFIFILAAVCLCFGVCFAATWSKAVSQPYLCADTVRFTFMGYYMTAMAWGALCVLSALVLVLCVIGMRKSESVRKNQKNPLSDSDREREV